MLFVRSFVRADDVPRLDFVSIFLFRAFETSLNVSVSFCFLPEDDTLQLLHLLLLPPLPLFSPSPPSFSMGETASNGSETDQYDDSLLWLSIRFNMFSRMKPVAFCFLPKDETLRLLPLLLFFPLPLFSETDQYNDSLLWLSIRFNMFSRLVKKEWVREWMKDKWIFGVVVYFSNVRIIYGTCNA